MRFSRRQLLTLLLAGAAARGGPVRAAMLERTLRLAASPLCNPGDDWSTFAEQLGWSIQALTISDDPEAIRSMLYVESEAGGLDLIYTVGGMIPMLAHNNLIEPIDTERLSRWQDNDYIQSYFVEGKPGYPFISLNGKIHAVPTLLQGDSFVYRPDISGKLTSYGDLFDPQWKGRVAIEDNAITCGQKTALYLKNSGLAAINDPSDLLPGEIRSVVNFLIEKKQQGQFHTLWTSAEEALRLLASKEVAIVEGPESLVAAARAEGVNTVHAAPVEGYLLWALTAAIVRVPERDETTRQALYDFIDFLLDGWYGARLSLLRGAMTNPEALSYAEDRPETFGPDELVRLQALDGTGRLKLEKGGVWRNGWPTNRKLYEIEWSRFKMA